MRAHLGLTAALIIGAAWYKFSETYINSLKSFGFEASGVVDFEKIQRDAPEWVSVLKTDHAHPDDSAYWQTLLNQAVDMYQLIPNAELVVLPNATHFSALSELSVNIVLDFLTRHTLTENEAKDAG